MWLPALLAIVINAIISKSYFIAFRLGGFGHHEGYARQSRCDGQGPVSCCIRHWTCRSASTSGVRIQMTRIGDQLIRCGGVDIVGESCSARGVRARITSSTINPYGVVGVRMFMMVRLFVALQRVPEFKLQAWVINSYGGGVGIVGGNRTLLMVRLFAALQGVLELKSRASETRSSAGTARL